MEKKNIIIISAAAVLVILIAAWFIFNPTGTDETKKNNSQSVVQQQTQPPAAEAPKEEPKIDSKPKEKNNVKQITENEIYTVKEGDTLQKISVEFYGETKYWLDIFAANEPNIDWYDNLKPGLELIIPKIN